MSVEFFQSIVMIHFHDYYAFFSSKQQIKKTSSFRIQYKQQQHIDVNPRPADGGFYGIDRPFF